MVLAAIDDTPFLITSYYHLYEFVKRFIDQESHKEGYIHHALAMSLLLCSESKPLSERDTASTSLVFSDHVSPEHGGPLWLALTENSVLFQTFRTSTSFDAIDRMIDSQTKQSGNPCCRLVS